MDTKTRPSSNISQVIRIGFPLLAGTLSFYLLQIADTAMIGRLGTTELAAIAMAGLFTHILFTFIWPVSVGVQAIVARRFGKQQKQVEEGGDPEEACRQTGEVLDNGILVGIIAGAIGLLFSFCAGFVFDLLFQDKTLIPLGLSYVNILRWFLPISSLMMVFTGFLSGINRTKDIMIANIMGSLLNILFNYILIFGKLGFPAMGIPGAAWGTVLAVFVQILYLFLRVALPAELRKYRSFTFQHIQFSLMGNIIRVMIPVAIQNIIALGVILVYESVIGSIGTVYLAVTHIVFSLFRINKTLIGGIARGASILVGNALGAGDKEEATAFIIACEKIAAVIGFVILGVILLFPEGIVRIFTAETEAVTIGVRAMYFFAPFFFLEVMGFSFEMIFTANGWGRFVLFSEFSTNMVFILGVTFLLVRVLGFGIYAAWTGFALYQAGHAIILTIGYLSKRWIHIEVEKGR